MDSSEILGVLLASKLPFNVNVFICGGFVFGGEAAMYSVLAYMIAAKLMDTVVNGFNELTAFHIFTVCSTLSRIRITWTRWGLPSLENLEKP